MFQIAAPAKLVKPLNRKDDMAKLNCNIGDLAVIVDAFNTENIGTFVKILRIHPNQRRIFKPEGDLLWMVESCRPMVYDLNGKITKRMKGAAPDSVLRPIRGLPLGKDIAEGLKELFPQNSQLIKQDH